MPEWTGRPVVMNLKAGETIAYCMCGLSKDGPVCDGTHKGTSITPQVEKYGADSRISACGCKPKLFRYAMVHTKSPSKPALQGLLNYLYGASLRNAIHAV